MGYPKYGSNQIKCGKKSCGWQGYETDLAKKPLKSGGLSCCQSVCPRCGYESYIFIREKEVAVGATEERTMLNEILPLNPDTTVMEDWLNSWVKCTCGCRRKVKNCKRYIETESWEMPWIKYEVCICPKCGNDMEENE